MGFKWWAKLFGVAVVAAVGLALFLERWGFKGFVGYVVAWTVIYLVKDRFHK
jgi:hypothetical protein